jgi:hypothetical protein
VRSAALLLYFLGIGGLFLVGIQIVCFPSRIDPSSFLGRHSLISGWVLLTISAAIVIVEMQRWVKVLPGILVFAVLNGLIMLFTGHLLNNASIGVSRFDVTVLTVFFAVSSYLSRTFKDRKLRVIDRIALFIFVSSIAWFLVSDSTRITATGRLPRLAAPDFVLMGMSLCCVFVAWGYDRAQQRRAVTTQ